MKKIFLKSILLLCALVVGSGSVWAGTYTYDIGTYGANGFYTNSELTTHPGSGNTNTISSFYASDGKLFTASAATIYFSSASSGYLFVPSGVTITLPTYSGEKITNITLYNSGSCSTKVQVSIVSGSSTASASQTWTATSSSYSYNITSTYQSSTLGIAVANKNGQISKIVITTESLGKVPSATVSTASLDFGKVDFGYSKNLTFTVTPSNLTGNLTIASNNAKYTVSPTSIAQSTTTATTITVTAAPTAIDNDMDGTITISGGGLSENRTVTLSCTVTDPSKNNGTLERPYTVADVNDGTASGDDVYVVGYIVGEFVSKDDPAKTSEYGGTNLALSDSPTEVSGANTIPVQLPSGSLRTAWNLNSNNVIGYKVRIRGALAGYFTGKTGVKPPTEITALIISLTPAKTYTTLTSAYNLDFTNVEGLKAYIATTVSGDAVQMTQVNKVPAGTGLVLKATTPNTAVNVPIFDGTGADDVNDNKMAGSATATTAIAANGGYILKDGAFHPANAGTLAAGKAYLAIAVSSAHELIMDFDESETTALTLVNSEKRTVNSDIYDLQGRKVAQPTKGLYIVNGKKVIIK